MALLRLNRRSVSPRPELSRLRCLCCESDVIRFPARHDNCVRLDSSLHAYFFFSARTLAHRARCAAAIFLRADADIVRLEGAEPVTVFAGCDPFRALPITFSVRG